MRQTHLLGTGKRNDLDTQVQFLATHFLRVTPGLQALGAGFRAWRKEMSKDATPKNCFDAAFAVS